MTGASSEAGPHEIEVKFRVDDRASLERRLTSLGATKGRTDVESNVLFDDDAMTLKNGGSALRIRTVEGRGLVTYKGKASYSGGLKRRLELESAVSDPDVLARILTTLGFSPRFTYEKRRVTWTFAERGRPEVVIDETPIGLFAEIEGDEEAVRKTAADLGVSEEAFIKESYVALYQAARRNDPSLPPDMVFRPA